jgi:hypothetical protein
LQTVLAVPHGIYDITNNQACINLGSSHDTAEFFFEHKAFPHVTGALSGIVSDNLQTVKELIETRAETKNGLKTTVNIMDKIYETGKKASDFFMEKMLIVFDKFLPKWNYKAMPDF